MPNIEWVPSIQPNRKFKEVSETKLRQFGLTSKKAQLVNNLEELKESPPNIVIAKASKSLKFVQNYFKAQELKKNISYVMGLGVFQQLHADQRYGNIKFLKPSKVKFKNMYHPYRGQSLEEKSLIVFRTGGIGDLLFIQPNLYYLKEKYPTCKILFACGPQYQSMVETWSCVDKVLDLPFPLTYLVQCDYHALFEGVIERCKLAEKENSYNLFSKWLGLDLPDKLLIPKQTPKKEKVDYCLEKLNSWNIKSKSFILMQVRASSPVRTPRPQIWIDIINKLTSKGFNVILTDNPRQSKIVNDFIKQLDHQDKVFNFCKYSESLDYSIALASLAGCVVGTDSALNHIAASVDVPCVGLYGPFPGAIRLKTYPKAKWVDVQKDCAPCFLHGQNPCPQAKSSVYSPCYDNLDINLFVKKIYESFDGDY